jgi:nucleoside-diphosphate-sugar epimerase
MYLLIHFFEVQLWYNVSKTLAEKSAWEFAEKEGLQLVVLNPGTTLGPFFTPSVNTSLNILLQLLRGLSFASLLQICKTMNRWNKILL